MNIRPAIIIIENQKLLTLKYCYSNQDVFCLPGGNLEFGENMAEALKRELKEELNLDVYTNELLLVGEIHTEEKTTLHCVFKGEIKDGKPTINPKETTAIAAEWIPLADLKNINLYPNISEEIYNMYINGQKPELYKGQITQVWH